MAVNCASVAKAFNEETRVRELKLISDLADKWEKIIDESLQRSRREFRSETSGCRFDFHFRFYLKKSHRYIGGIDNLNNCIETRIWEEVAQVLSARYRAAGWQGVEYIVDRMIHLPNSYFFALGYFYPPK